VTRVREHTEETANRAAPERSSSDLIYHILLAGGVLAAIVGILKGFTTTVDPATEFYWLFNYGHGFIKRGLIGTIVTPLVSRVSLEHAKPAIAAAHAIACLSIALMFVALFRGAIFAERRADSRLALALSFVCLMCSEMLPVLATDTGSVDPYVIVFVLAGVRLILKRRYAIAVVVGIVGPFIHEGFVLAWAPLAILLLWSCVSSDEQRVRKLAVAAVPVLTAFVVTTAHNADALGQLMQAWPASEEIKNGHLAYTFGQTFRTSFAHMKDYEFPGHWSNFGTAFAFFVIPNGLLLWTAAFCYWHRWSARGTTLLVGVVAMLSPLGAIALAWDLSRFLVWSTVGAAVVLLGLGSAALTGLNEESA
jgi:hypothetical protein